MIYIHPEDAWLEHLAEMLEDNVPTEVERRERYHFSSFI